MSEELIIRYCSPTLAGIKTGNIFACPCQCVDELRAVIRCWNRRLTSKGLRILPLRFKDGRAMIYVYRPSRLYCDLTDKTASRLLSELGYAGKSPEQYLAQLIKRLHSEEFPHEIGLFLGYPPEDVCAFIENRAKNFKCIGCWKVYGDAEAARRIFRKYQKCTDIYCARYASGSTVECLTVTV